MCVWNEITFDLEYEGVFWAGVFQKYQEHNVDAYIF